MKYLFPALTCILLGLTVALSGSAASAQGPQMMSGRVFVDGAPAPAGSVVQAVVNGAPCGQAQAVLAQGATTAGSTVAMPFAGSAAPQECTKPGSAVTFLVNGRPANETVTVGDLPTDKPLLISVGTPVAAYRGRLDVPSAHAGARIIVSSERLGRCLMSEPLAGPNYDYELAVPKSGRCNASLFPESQGRAFSDGEELIFWLAYGDGGGGELLTVSDPAQSHWAPGFHDLNLIKVPCLDPCPPPPGAGPADPDPLQTGDVQDPGPRVGLVWILPLAASLVAAVGVALLLSRRRRHTE